MWVLLIRFKMEKARLVSSVEAELGRRPRVW